MEICLAVAGVLILVLLGLRLHSYFKDCMWYWDDIEKCYKTQCGRRYGSRKGDDKDKNSYCPFCGKPKIINPFIIRSDGTP